MDCRTPAAVSHRGLFRAALVLVVALGVVVGAAVHAPQAAAAQKCASRIFKDWSDNHRIDRVYGLPCYRAAIKALPVDVRTYSSAEDDIRRAMLYAQSDKTDPGDKGPAAPAASSHGSSSASDDTAIGSSARPPAVKVPAKQRAGKDTSMRVTGNSGLAPVDQASLPIPLPLIGLAAVSALLLTFGSVGYVTRRIAHHLHSD
jgi:hypothetical protein